MVTCREERLCHTNPDVLFFLPPEVFSCPSNDPGAYWKGKGLCMQECRLWIKAALMKGSLMKLGKAFPKDIVKYRLDWNVGGFLKAGKTVLHLLTKGKLFLTLHRG